MCRPPTSLWISHSIYETLILSVALFAAVAVVFAPQLEAIWNYYYFFLFPASRKSHTCHKKSSSKNNLLTNQHLEPIAKRQWRHLIGWITFHSDQVGKLRDSKGQTILHHACLFQSPLLVIECILWAAPELASIPNKDGEVPLHWAVRLSSQNPVLTILLQADPDTAFAVDYTQSTPLAMMWEKHCKRSMELFRYRGPEALLSNNNNAWKRLMSVFQAVSEAKDCQQKEFFPLHIAAQKVTPTGMFPFLMQVYKDELLQEDENGNTPLTIACRNPESNRLSIDIYTKIEYLLQADSEQARHPISSECSNSSLGVAGRFHLHHALESGVGWKEGLEALLKVHPSALSERDPVSGLFPFALAATTTTNHNGASMKEEDTEGDQQLTTIYDLLRSDPSVIRMQVQ